MDSHRISTEVIPRRRAFAFWQDVICDTFIHLDCTSSESGSFSGELTSQPLGDCTLSSMASDPIDLTRSRARISAAREEYCLVVVQGRGRTLAEQDGRRIVLDTGDLALFDSARPYFAALQSGFHHYVLKVPRDSVRRRLGPVEGVTATRVAGHAGVGKIASSFIRGLLDEAGAVDDAIRRKLAETSMDLVAAALASALPVSTAASVTRVAHLARAKSFIAANAQRFDLAPEHVAAATGLSGRYLRELFADDGDSVSRYLWSYRYEKCKAALADPAQAHRAISDIAFGWGFNDMSHFSRLFRERTGVSARAFREAALSRSRDH
jgi:AraC-like DNA-binding protein